MSQEITTRFRVLPLGAVKPKGWILTQLKRDIEEGFAGRLDQLTEHAANDLFKNRIDTSQDHYAWWDSETRGNWLWGLLMMAFLAEHEETKSRLRNIVEDLKNSKDDDGYIGIYARNSRYNHVPGENGELWSQGRALLILLTYYELAGDASYLEVVEEVVQLTMRHYGPGHSYFKVQGTEENFELGGLFHGLNYVDVMEWLYSVTGKTEYRDFGVWLYQDFNSIPGHFPNDDLKVRNLLIDKLPFSGHAAHTGEHLRVLFWAYVMTGEPDMQKAVEQAIKRTRHFTVNSGALIGDENVHGLPLPEAGYEYCTMTELALSLISALQKFGNADYGDWLENLVFNAGQGARFADGTGICYLSMDNRLQATGSRPDTSSFVHVVGRYKYSPTHEDVAVCCNPNAVRFMPHYVSRMWMALSDRDGLVAVAYGPSVLNTQLNGVSVQIEQDTFYPFSETIKFIVSVAEDVPFDLLLRRPAWAREMKVTVAGTSGQESEGYYRIHKVWSHQEEVIVTFDVEVEILQNPTGEYSVRRGPLQYAMEIPYERHPIKSYAVNGFHDYDIIPQNVRQSYQIVVLDKQKENYGLEYSYDELTSRARPWDEPPCRLNKDGISLVPMGATVLRRSTFPIQ